jgi:hypothetical protein
VFGVLSVIGVSERNTATAWWLTLVIGLIATAPTALTGLIDWGIEWGSPLWRTATAHLLSMVTATVSFLLAAIFHPRIQHCRMNATLRTLHPLKSGYQEGLDRRGREVPQP